MIVPPAAAYWERRLSLQATIPGMRKLGAVDGGVFFGVLAVAALALVVAMVLAVAAGPVDTSDFWFHAKAGETYANEGPWPLADPMLHTAHADAPVQHEWLFGVAVHQLDSIVGLPGLRVVQVLAVLGILAVAGMLYYREGESLALAAAATCVLAVLCWPRLVQLRPDLFTIPASLVLYALLLKPREGPSWPRVAGACLLVFVWANMHSLFGVGLLLVLAGWIGVVLRAGLLRWIDPPAAERENRRAVRLAVAEGLLFFSALLNPRGLDQHLTFFSSSKEFGIWKIVDEWSPFNPWAWPSTGGGVVLGDLAWATTNLVFVAVMVATLVGAVRFLARRDRGTLEAIDPVRFGLAAASAVAILTSVRFLWMAFFPLIFLLHFSASQGAGSLRARRALAGVATTVACALAVGLAFDPGYRDRIERLPSTLAGYWSEPWIRHGSHDPGVRFLSEASLEGNLYNRYTMGGLLGYRLAPGMRTFVDGRTEHYPADVLDDYFRIAHQREVRPGETALEALDRRKVDVYFGVGFPAEGEHIYTTADLEGAPGWKAIWRGLGHALYLRENERNRENLARVAEYYAGINVPFDSDRGLDPDRVVREAPEWMISQGLLPEAYSTWQTERTHPDPAVRHRALGPLGRVSALLGAYGEEAEADREAVELRPREKAPRRRRVYGALRQGHADVALVEARALVALDPVDPRSLSFLQLAREVRNRLETEKTEIFASRVEAYLERRRDEGTPAREEGWLVPVQAAVSRLPLLGSEERRACCAEFD